MSEQPKTSLKLPIFLMIGPALGLVLSLILYAVINFMVASSAPEVSTAPSLSDHAGITQTVDDQSVELFGDSSIFRTTSNVLLFILGSVSMLAFVPCLIFGIITLNKRRNTQTDKIAVMENKESREWGDLE